MKETKNIENMGKLESFWIENTEKTNFPALKEGLSVDVAILGAGIAGITSALFLKEAGLSVALIEAERVIKDVTANTTAKITAAHNVIYSNLESHFGKDGARTYAEANQAAIDKIESLIKERNIQCDFKRLSCYVYSENKDERETLKKEAKPQHVQDFQLHILNHHPCLLILQEQFSMKIRPNSIHENIFLT